ncbi:MAG: HNH endonuclease, partial [Bacilli bacterium]|nr:HNH endonuclease [Bacilli bacterium]
MYYEYLLNELVTSNQVKLNLRRTIDKGLISSLNRLQEVKLALKYFGVDKNGNYTSDTDNIVNYRCPYSGEIGYNNLVLDHIIPVKSKGGTVLFNCIPVNKTINWNKHSNNLLTWWNNKSYFDYERLDRLVQYILEAYEIYDKEIIEEDDYIYEEENILEEQEELTKSITKEDIEEDKIDTNINESVTYYQFITNLIEKLSNDRNVDIYKERLLKLKEENKFGELTELDEIIKIVQKIIEEKIGNDNEISSSYSLNINIRKLYNSLKTKEYEKEIRERVNKIEEILKQENKPFTSYFKNLVDIEEYNILYFTSLDDNKINNFINSLKIDFDTKLELFIEMMAMDKYTDYKNGQPFGDNIFSQTNKVPFKGIKEEYGLNTATFWYRNQDKIIPRIEEKIEKLLNKDELTEEE